VGATTQSPVGIQIGTGVKVGATYKIHEQGPTKTTQHPYDLAIEGRGFFPVMQPNGQVGYSRVGNFHLDSQRKMTLSNGSQLIPQFSIPSNAIEISVSPTGEVKALLHDHTEAQLGQIQLVSFANEQGLTAAGAGLYGPTSASGAPIQGVPGENGLGTIAQGALEASNVNVANSMVEMIAAQRAYEMGTKTMKVADEMLGATANIK
jgi:flagellar basal-body rod protein FlgG